MESAVSNYQDRFAGTSAASQATGSCENTAVLAQAPFPYEGVSLSYKPKGLVINTGHHPVCSQPVGRRGLCCFSPPQLLQGSRGFCFPQLLDCLEPQPSVFSVSTRSHQHVLTHYLLIAGRETYSLHFAPEKRRASSEGR